MFWIHHSLEDTLHKRSGVDRILEALLTRLLEPYPLREIYPHSLPLEQRELPTEGTHHIKFSSTLDEEGYLPPPTHYIEWPLQLQIQWPILHPANGGIKW